MSAERHQERVIDAGKKQIRSERDGSERYR